MSDNGDVKSGVIREHGSSVIQKWTFILGHLFIVLICFWIVYFNGVNRIAGILGQGWSLADPNRATLLLACVLLYWFRHVITLFYLLERKIIWSEVVELLFFMAFFEITLLLLGGGIFRDYSIEFGWLDIIALIFLLVGGYLNSYSEIQRKLWKKDSKNKGRCYTRGLFRYSMHINYFGDTVLFTGWCLFTYNYWTLSLPLFMAITFIYFHIPGLDLHLVERYGNEFKRYSEKTNKFIPFVY